MSRRESASSSLWWRLVIGLISVSILAMIAAGAGLYIRFETTNSRFREHSLSNQARVLVEYLKATSGSPLRVPSYIDQQFRTNSGKYAIVERDGALLAASKGVTTAFASIDPSEPVHYFILRSGGANATYYGLSKKSDYGGRPVWVQVAFVGGDIVFDTVLEDFVEDIGWIWIPFVLILLLVNLLVARIGLAPLRTAANEASAIGPGATSVRLTEGGLPADVYTLVRAVNRALDRLERALKAQRSFVADAAHELRTPVSVLKTHVAVLPEFDGRDALVDEVDALGRLVNQLLDSARLEVLDVKPSEIVDLNEVAEETGTQLGPSAINAGRSIEVIKSAAPVPINAAKHYVCQALRNIVENAIKHTPEGTIVSIKVSLPGSVSVTDRGPGVPVEHREAIFKRFWQGSDPGHRGAGLGLDIAARTAAAYGGTISVDNTSRGGAVFTMRFPAQNPRLSPEKPGLFSAEGDR